MIIVLILLLAFAGFLTFVLYWEFIRYRMGTWSPIFGDLPGDIQELLLNLKNNPELFPDYVGVTFVDIPIPNNKGFRALRVENFRSWLAEDIPDVILIKNDYGTRRIFSEQERFFISLWIDNVKKRKDKIIFEANKRANELQRRANREKYERGEIP